MRSGKDVENKRYLPSNLVWVAKHSETEELEERNFKELGALYTPKDPEAENSKTSKVADVNGLTFIHDTEQTVGSAPVEGLEDSLAQPLKSDRVYRVQKILSS